MREGVADRTGHCGGVRGDGVRSSGVNAAEHHLGDGWCVDGAGFREASLTLRARTSTDDLGYGEVGAYPCTSPHGRIATPTLDRFANEGMQFTQAYAGYTVCAPSRTALFTGRHSGQYVKYGLSGTAISPGQATVTSELLQQAGYETAIFGKTAPLTNPVEQGFGTFLGQVNQGYCHNMYPAYIDSGNETLNFELPLNTKKKNRSLTMANPAEYNFTWVYSPPVSSACRLTVACAGQR